MRAAMYERSTSMNNNALRSDCSKVRPPLVFVVAKNVRLELRMFSVWAWRPGLVICRG